jgi:hypothetical protein
MATAEQAQAAINSIHNTEHPDLVTQRLFSCRALPLLDTC